MSDNKGMKALTKAVKNKNDTFSTGTVIRWTAAERFIYVAVKSPVGWYSSARPGNVYVPSIMTFDTLLDIIGRAETTNVEVATDWKPVG
jgi:hypothetical protein